MITKKRLGKWLMAGLSCMLILSCGVAMKAEPLQTTTSNAAPPLTTNLDLTSTSTTLLDPADVRLCGTGCTGTNGTVSILTNDNLPTLSFQLTNGGTNTGEAYLAILVPSGNPMPSFTVNGNSATTLTSSVYSSGALTDFLAANVTNLSLASGSGANAQFSAYASASGQVISPEPSSFSVYVYDLGAFNGTPLPITFSSASSGLPNGSIFWGFLTNQACATGSCVLTDTTPLSEAVTVAPEPGTLTLAGSGLLLLLAGTVRRRLFER